MTTTLKVIYESGNGAIEVTKPNGEVTTLTQQGEETTISIHQGEDQQAVIKETGFVATEDTTSGPIDQEEGE